MAVAGRSCNSGGTGTQGAWDGAGDVIDEALISAIEAAHETGASEWRGQYLHRLEDGRIALWIEGNWVPFPSDEAIASYLTALFPGNVIAELHPEPDDTEPGPYEGEPEYEAGEAVAQDADAGELAHDDGALESAEGAVDAEPGEQHGGEDMPTGAELDDASRVADADGALEEALDAGPEDETAQGDAREPEEAAPEPGMAAGEEDAPTPDDDSAHVDEEPFFDEAEVGAYLEELLAQDEAGEGDAEADAGEAEDSESEDGKSADAPRAPEEKVREEMALEEHVLHLRPERLMPLEDLLEEPPRRGIGRMLGWGVLALVIAAGGVLLPLSRMGHDESPQRPATAMLPADSVQAPAAGQDAPGKASADGTAAPGTAAEKPDEGGAQPAGEPPQATVDPSGPDDPQDPQPDQGAPEEAAAGEGTPDASGGAGEVSGGGVDAADRADSVADAPALSGGADTANSAHNMLTAGTPGSARRILNFAIISAGHPCEDVQDWKLAQTAQDADTFDVRCVPEGRYMVGIANSGTMDFKVRACANSAPDGACE